LGGDGERKEEGEGETGSPFYVFLYVLDIVGVGGKGGKRKGERTAVPLKKCHRKKGRVISIGVQPNSLLPPEDAAAGRGKEGKKEKRARPFQFLEGVLGKPEA